MTDLTDPWEKARTRYLERLDPEEAVLFKEATIQNLYYATSNADREDKLKSKTRNAIAAIQPLVDKIEEYGKAMDAFANIAPTFLAPVWGSLRVILVLAKGFGSFYERMTNTLGRIGDILPRLFDYQRIFSHDKHPRLTESLANTYLDIIELCMEFRVIIKAQQKNVLKRVMQPLSSSVEQKFKDAEARFRAHKKTVEKEAETCHMIEAAEERAIALRDRQLQEMSNKAETRKKLFRLLSVSGSRQKHEKVRSVRHQDTGSWLFATTEYKAWYSLKSSTVLCCYGIPGCGKTILASSVIDSLLTAPESERCSVGYHYCDYADKRTLEPITILGTLVRSLLEVTAMPSEIAELIYEYYRDGDRTPETKDVLDILSRAIDLCKTVVLAIDGIDEVKEEDRQIIYDALKGISKSHRVPVKVFMSCREDTEQALCSIPGSSFRVQISEKVISTDIDDYIRHSVALLLEQGHLVIRRPELQQDMVNALIKGARGMFLWVKFQLDELCTTESDDAIKKTLLNLPKDLGETYDRLLGRIVGAERQELVKRMFRWIICARRPLRVDELCEGIAFTIDDRHWNEDKIPNDILRLVRACGNLVVIEEESRTVQLAHYTVQQYILNDQDSKEKFFHFNQAEADELLGEVCVAYLNFSDFETKVTVYVDNNVTAEMTAMQNAFTNVELALPNKGPLDTITLLTRMVYPKKKETKIDYNRHITKKTNVGEHLLDDFRLLGYVRENWLWHTARFLPNSSKKTRRDVLFHNLVLQKQLPFEFRPWNTNSHRKTEYPYFEPIGWALATNHGQLIHTIVKTDPTFKPETYFADAGSWFFEDRTSSTHISEHMLERISHCAYDSWEPKSMPRRGWLYSRMLNACRRGNLNILQSCIRFGVSSGDYPWPNIRGHLVIEAAAGDQKAILSYLMGQHSDSELMNDAKQTANLTFNNDFTIMFDGLACNALDRAALAGHVAMIHYLLQQGWKARGLLSGNAKEGIQQLNRAVVEDNLRLAEALRAVLEASGSSHENENVEDAKLMNAFDEAQQLRLTSALIAGQIEDVKLVLYEGADPNCKLTSPLWLNPLGVTPLIYAAATSKIGIISELLRAGADKEAADVDDCTALLLAAKCGNKRAVATLINGGASLRAEDSNGRRILEIAVEDRSLDLVEYLMELHEEAMRETPPRFLFTSRDSGKAIRNAMINDQGVMSSKALQDLSRHFSKAKMFQIKHQQGRSSELSHMWIGGEAISPEDEEPYELEWSQMTSEPFGFIEWIPRRR